MNERKYLPDIPLLPEEREALEKAREPKLPGAPSSVEDSVLLELEQNVPLWHIASQDLRGYFSLEKNEKRKDFKNKKIHSFLNNPQGLEAYLDTLRILEEHWQGQGDIEAYRKELFADLEKFIDVGTLPPVALQGWLTLLTSREEMYRTVAERVIKTILDKNRNPQSLIAYLYNLAEAILSVGDREVATKGLEVLMLGAPFLDDKSDRHILDYMKAGYTTNDDETLRRRTEVNVLINYLGPKYAPAVFEVMQNKTTLVGEAKEFKDFIKLSVSRDVAKLRALKVFYEHSPGSDQPVSEVSSDTLKKWPFTLVVQGGDVRKLCNKLVAEEAGYVSVALPNRGSTLSSPDQITSVIIEILNKPVEGNNELRDPEYIEALFYLTPEISKEKKEELSKDVVLLRREIYLEKTYGISPRGDRMLVSDEEISALSIKSITFKIGEHPSAISAYVEVGNYNFALLINQNFEIKDVSGHDLVFSFEQRAFMEHLILSYLKELMCTERVKLNNGVKNGKSHIEREQEFKDRRPHLRKLSPGNAYSKEAQAQGLADPFRWDLARINSELGLTKFTGQKTYVKESHRPLPGEVPLESRAPHATDRLKRILSESNE